jgi:ArsR family metal-binding transcriptional regulator
MLIQSYDLEIQASKHSAEEFDFEAVAHLALDIREVLPYLNAVLRNGVYHPDHPAFSWRKEGLEVAVWPNRIAVEPFESREAAKEMIEELVNLVNDVWEKRGEIEPDTKMRENLQPLELYRLLPKTNCKACGESTCFNFALKLAAGQVKLEQCGPVRSENVYAEQLAQLEFLLKTKRTLL